MTRFLELGPDGVLTALAQSSLPGGGTWLVPALRKDRAGEPRVLAAVGRAARRRRRRGLAGVLRGTGARRVDLPTYAFQRQRYWLEAASPRRLPAALRGRRRFWDAVEREDLESLAADLAIGTDQPLTWTVCCPPCRRGGGGSVSRRRWMVGVIGWCGSR